MGFIAERLVIWFVIEDKQIYKKLKFNQFWVTATSDEEALESIKEESKKLNFTPKVMGISYFRNIENGRPDLYQNKTFH